MPTPKTVLIDTDPGLDDALALALAFGSGELSVRAVTVVAGNVPLAACTANALRILRVLRPDSPPPVFEGCRDPLSPRVARAEHVHGGDGLGGLSREYSVGDLRPGNLHAADAMAAMARRHGDALTVIALGPLTNVAAAVERDAAAMRGIRELIVMGGSRDRRGNATSAAEFNFYSDPLAASRVLRSGLPVTLVGLNVTRRALLPRAQFEARCDAMNPGPLRSFLSDVAAPFFGIHRSRSGRDACSLHDPLAVAAAIDPDIVGTEDLDCDVVTEQGLTRGMMICRPPVASRSPVRVAVSVDAQRFLETFLGMACDA